MDVYRIANWDKIYENHKTRIMPNIRRVQIPIDFESEGYLDFTEKSDGAALFGAWVSIVQVAGKCKIRGTLVKSKGEPHDFKSIARLTRWPEDLIRETIGFSLTVSKWLEIIPLAEAGHLSAEIGTTEGRKERKEGRKGASTPPVLFESLPEILRNPPFFLAWKEWEQYRKERKKPLIPMTIKKQLKFCEKLGSSTAIISINNAIEKGWQGLFPPDKKEAPANINSGLQNKRWKNPHYGPAAAPESLMEIGNSLKKES